MSWNKLSGAQKKGLLTWLLLGVLGLVALSAGVLVPHTLPEADRAAADAAGAGKQAPAASLPPAREQKEEEAYSPPPLPDLPSARTMMLRLGLGTAFVLLLCCATLWCGKRWLRAYALPETAARQMQVLEVLPLGGRCSVLLLQAGRCRVLAGMDGTGLKSLVPLPEPFESTLADLAEANKDEVR